MVATGLMLWFDNWIISFLPKGVLDVALVIHYWEAWLATLAIPSGTSTRWSSTPTSTR